MRQHHLPVSLNLVRSRSGRWGGTIFSETGHSAREVARCPGPSRVGPKKFELAGRDRFGFVGWGQEHFVETNAP